MAVSILIADDHPIFRAGIRSLLDAESSFEIVAEVADGLDAVKAAREQKPDVVVIDISMAGMNGLEATLHITGENTSTKVLCLSMHSDPHFADAALRSGAHGYLIKECAPQELFSAIRAVVAGGIYVSPGLGDVVLENYRNGRCKSSSLSGLTLREREVLQLLAEGQSAHDIAARLHVSVKTVGTHREHLMHKVGTHSLAGLTKFAIREGLTSVEQ